MLFVSCVNISWKWYMKHIDDHDDDDDDDDDDDEGEGDGEGA